MNNKCIIRVSFLFTSLLVATAYSFRITSNLTTPPVNSFTVPSYSYWLATEFATDNNAYRLDYVVARMGISGFSQPTDLRVRIFNSDSGSPGYSIGDLIVPTFIPESVSYYPSEERIFHPLTNIILSATSTYFIVMSTTYSQDYGWERRDISEAPAVIGPGDIPPRRWLTYDQGTNWIWHGSSTCLFEVHGSFTEKLYSTNYITSIHKENGDTIRIGLTNIIVGSTVSVLIATSSIDPEWITNDSFIANSSTTNWRGDIEYPIGIIRLKSVGPE